MIEWQPIETAPKNREILVCCDDGDGHPRFDIVEWVDWKPGWFNGDFAWGADAFTHWAELKGPM